VRLVVDGLRRGRNTGFLVNGERVLLNDAHFVSFLRLVVAHRRSPGTWIVRDDAISDHVSRIRVAIRHVYDDGAPIVESDRNGGVRLRPDVVLESVDWRMLEGHAEMAVQKIVKEHRDLG
jgi:hypothetical protein